jgi:transposase-like protein
MKGGTPMEAVRLLPQSQILHDWWSEVKENFWQDDAKPQVLKLVKELMESTLQEEMVLQAKREPYERLNEQSSYRNGYYRRGLVTQFGTINDIRVPRLREGVFKTKVFRRYKRYEDMIEDMIEGIFLAGVSTRRVGDAVAKLLDTKISHGTVSRIAKRLDAKVKEYRRRPLLDEYQYLILDAITLKIRYSNAYHNRKVLVAYGITMFGERHLISFTQSQGESADAWEGFLNDLYHRGLIGTNLKLIAIDGSRGLRSALRLVYPRVFVQRCWAHKGRNVANYLPKRYQKECTGGLKGIYDAKDRHYAILAFKAWKHKWIKISARAVQCVESDLEELLSVYDMPVSHRKKVRTTNVIERSFREVRRRTRVFSCFSNKESCDRIIYAIFTHLNNQWKEHPIKKFTQFC